MAGTTVPCEQTAPSLVGRDRRAPERPVPPCTSDAQLVLQSEGRLPDYRAIAVPVSCWEDPTAHLTCTQRSTLEPPFQRARSKTPRSRTSRADTQVSRRVAGELRRFFGPEKQRVDCASSRRHRSMWGRPAAAEGSLSGTQTHSAADRRTFSPGCSPQRSVRSKGHVVSAGVSGRSSSGSGPDCVSRGSPGRPRWARLCGGLSRARNVPRLSDGGHQRRREHNRGVLVDAGSTRVCRLRSCNASGWAS